MPFGLGPQLYDAFLRAQTERGRARLLSGAARCSAPVFGLPAMTALPAPGGSAGGRAARALLAHQRFGLPTGDAHRARRPSVGRRRLADVACLHPASPRRLPVAARRCADGEGVELGHLAPEGAHVELVTLSPLSDDGVRAVLTDIWRLRPTTRSAARPARQQQATRCSSARLRAPWRMPVWNPTGGQAADAVRVPSEQMTRLVGRGFRDSRRTPPRLCGPLRSWVPTPSCVTRQRSLISTFTEPPRRPTDCVRAMSSRPGSRLRSAIRWSATSWRSRSRRAVAPPRTLARRGCSTTNRSRPSGRGASAAQRARWRRLGGESAARRGANRSHARRPRKRRHCPASRAARGSSGGAGRAADDAWRRRGAPARRAGRQAPAGGRRAGHRTATAP